MEPIESYENAHRMFKRAQTNVSRSGKMSNWEIPKQWGAVILRSLPWGPGAGNQGSIQLLQVQSWEIQRVQRGWCVYWYCKVVILYGMYEPLKLMRASLTHVQIQKGACQNCPSGKYQSTEGGTECIPAPSGYFVSSPGLADSASCPANTRSEKNLGSAECLTVSLSCW